MINPQGGKKISFGGLIGLLQFLPVLLQCMRHLRIPENKKVGIRNTNLYDENQYQPDNCK
jgi:hypothetical protein